MGDGVVSPAFVRSRLPGASSTPQPLSFPPGQRSRSSQSSTDLPREKHTDERFLQHTNLDSSPILTCHARNCDGTAVAVAAMSQDNTDRSEAEIEVVTDRKRSRWSAMCRASIVGPAMSSLPTTRAFWRTDELSVKPPGWLDRTGL